MCSHPAAMCSHRNCIALGQYPWAVLPMMRSETWTLFHSDSSSWVQSQTLKAVGFSGLLFASFYLFTQWKGGVGDAEKRGGRKRKVKSKFCIPGQLPYLYSCATQSCFPYPSLCILLMLSYADTASDRLICWFQYQSIMSEIGLHAPEIFLPKPFPWL